MTESHCRTRQAVVHCFRNPRGGVFRHVIDLARGQHSRGWDVGIICNAISRDEHADCALAELSRICSLGIHRLPIDRFPRPSDLRVIHAIERICSSRRVTILHGHGAKGGLYARLVARRMNAKSVYTPHGGSLHFSRSTLSGALYNLAEWALKHRTDGLIFECESSAATYQRRLGRIHAPFRTVHYGVHQEDFTPVSPGEQACDFVFIGTMRRVKGVDLLLDAIAELRRRGRRVSAAICGSGERLHEYQERANSLGLCEGIEWRGAIHPARDAFALGRCLVVPSRREAFPYIVLEGAAAGIPIIATAVGGIPEVLCLNGAEMVVQPNDSAALAIAMEAVLNEPESANGRAMILRDQVRQRFEVNRMVDEILGFYGCVAGES